MHEVTITTLFTHFFLETLLTQLATRMRTTARRRYSGMFGLAHQGFQILPQEHSRVSLLQVRVLFVHGLQNKRFG